VCYDNEYVYKKIVGIPVPPGRGAPDYIHYGAAAWTPERDTDVMVWRGELGHPELVGHLFFREDQTPGNVSDFVPAWGDGWAVIFPGNVWEASSVPVVHLTGPNIGSWWSRSDYTLHNEAAWYWNAGWVVARAGFKGLLLYPLMSLSQRWADKQDLVSELFPILSDVWDAKATLGAAAYPGLGGWLYPYNGLNLFSALCDTLAGLGQTFATLKEEGIIPAEVGETLTPESLEALAADSGNSGSPETMALIDDLQGTLRNWKMMCLGAVTGCLAVGTGLLYLQKKMHHNTRVKRLLDI
jgi:hypothetical protein